MGYTSATPIQEQVILPALSGRDLIGQAQTGTGKTAAFSIPLLEKVDTEVGKVQALVLAPTRELAIQVAEEMTKLGRHKGVNVLAVYGGQEISRQIRALKNRPHVIIATPGRLIDHIERRTIRLADVHTVVLDEADEMLNMGFLDEIQKILSQVPSERQTMLFSATMPAPIRKLADQFLRDPEHISVVPQTVKTAAIAQSYVEVREREKFDVLCRLIDIEGPQLAVVFGRTKRRVDELAAGLQKRGYLAEGLHGDLSQNQRDQVMRKFREGRIQLLVATDVAARGIDVSNVSHVFNFDLPQDPESYVHRIGRTGRAGREGVAISLVTPNELDHLQFIERVNKIKLKKRPAPTKKEALIGQLDETAEKLTTAIQESNLDSYLQKAAGLLAEFESEQIVAAALKLLTRDSGDVHVELTPEKPLRTRKPRGAGSGSGFNRRSNDWKRGEKGHAGSRDRNDRKSRDWDRERGAKRSRELVKK
ncbi:DEAD/DEAH box helicase [Brevibacillus fulvus]|nr:DEAD/DEAH box helicase [Brevibacillus fulvus]